MEGTINNFKELLDFIKKDEVNSKQATEIVYQALKVISLFDMTKDDVIKATEYHIKTFCQNDNSERPIFLNQRSLEFDIKEVW